MLALPLSRTITRTARSKSAGRRSKMKLPSQQELISCLLQDKIFSTQFDSHWHGNVEEFSSLLEWSNYQDWRNSPSQAVWYLGNEKAFAPAVNGHPHHLWSVGLWSYHTWWSSYEVQRYFNVLQNVTQQVDHKNRLDKQPIKYIVNNLNLNLDEYNQLFSPPTLTEVSVFKAQTTKVPFKCHVKLEDPTHYLCCMNYSSSYPHVSRYSSVKLN